MRSGVLCALLLAGACNSTNPNAVIGEFSSPTGLGATGAGDRDLVFIANSGRDSVRALMLCNIALLADGGVDPADHCRSDDNNQFVPAPIRVFPASIETGERPLRIAGVRLRRSDDSAAGVGLVAGADTTVAILDARNLVDSVHDDSIQPRDIDYLDVGGRTIDVVAANPVDERDLEVPAKAGSPVTAFVVTESDLVVFDMSLDAVGLPAHPTVSGRCSLSPVQPTRIAVVPGSGAQVYVADGAGDGVVSIATAGIPPAPPPGTPAAACPMDRISAGGHSVRSIALSPRWYAHDPQATHPPGELLMMVLEPADAAQPGRELDPGGVLFAGTGLGPVPKGIVPIPPFGLQEVGTLNEEPMQPLALPGVGLLREGAFLRAVPPQPSPRPPDLSVCTAAPCTPLYVQQPSNAPVHLFDLLAAVSATDGSTYFIEVPLRRFVNQNTYALPGDAQIVPVIDVLPSFAPVTPQIPVLNINTSAFEPGVTHRTGWRAVWHSPIPGLERRGGIMAPTAQGTLTFTSQANLPLWRNDPAIALAVGDVVSFGAFSVGSDSSAACGQIVSTEQPYRFELPIVAIPDASTLELAELADNGTIRGFHPEGCSSFGAVAEVRTAGTQPWLVLEGATVRGRVQPDGNFTVHQRRFDYPKTIYDPANPPGAAKDVAFTFAITGAAPTIPRSFFSWSINSGQIPLSYSDAGVAGGFATAVYGYSSPRHQSLVFTSVTGGNEVVQADPSVLISTVNGVLTYR